MSTLGVVAGIGLGVLVVLAITALTGYFVAQEFGYMAVDRSRLRSRANTGDAGAKRALGITARTSFMLSGAQLGITVTGLLVGYVAEPLIGDGIGELLGGVGIPAALGIGIGTAAALLFATVVQMVFGELFPKNLAIARPEPVARALALSTAVYLRLFGWLIRLFDASSNLLLRALRIEPVHDVEHAATPRDLEAIIEESRDSGDLDAELSTLLDRVLEFTERTARTAMIPRVEVASVPADATVGELVRLMASGHSRYPVLGAGGDEVLGVVYLRDVLARRQPDPTSTGRRVDLTPVSDLAREPLLVPASLPLPAVLTQLRAAGEEMACVLDEYGGLAGIITTEDIAEELVGEITDEHDPAGIAETRGDDGKWLVPGTLHIHEVERLIDHDLPPGDYQSIGGLVIETLQRLPTSGDTLTLDVPARPGTQHRGARRRLNITVHAVRRRVPATIRLAWTDTEDATDGEDRATAGDGNGDGAAGGGRAVSR